MKNFIFSFILFALLLTVNADPFQLNKRPITFEACDPKLDLLTVKIRTNPPEIGKSESFDVSGNLTKNDITINQTFLIIEYQNVIGAPIADDYIQTFNNSFKAGTPFKISASDVPTPKLPDIYMLGVGVGNNKSDDMFACVYALVNGRSSEKN
ncbi:hypothetical protein C2G38_2161313 [Gigaspora rosea]|uniref:MD-2-related lipid-recognition domain-containing protein n=1 Tax=Gigaspora rosea TaxID=44941 RepID=A0A397VX13_9GLOM|nr:hypothetical protein C2G38_2161313 [Gigaspora rosea]